MLKKNRVPTRMLFLALKYAFLFLGLAHVSYAAQLKSIRFSGDARQLNVACSVDGYARAHMFMLHGPERLVIDLPQTTTSLIANRIHRPSGLIKQLRIGKPTPQTLRVVFDLSRPMSMKELPPTATERIRLQLISRVSGLSSAQVSMRTLPISTKDRIEPNRLKPQITQRPVRALHIPPRSLRDVVVVIDPGHGGHDPGAMGMHHTREKQIVLSIALKLKQCIDKQPGMRAVLTRSGDYYVGLRDRMHIARRYNGDIFVAIHADAFGNHASHGASVFALSQRGATSEAARWLAAKENYSELGGVNLSELDDQNGVIRSVLIDLSQTATINASLLMGSKVLQQLNQITTLHSSRVEQARFMVLKSPDIPSVLIETGFISNPTEEARLSNPAYQMRLSQAITTGLKIYFWDYPPHGSRIEALSGANRRLLTQRSGFFNSRHTI